MSSAMRFTREKLCLDSRIKYFSYMLRRIPEFVEWQIVIKVLVGVHLVILQKLTFAVFFFDVG